MMDKADDYVARIEGTCGKDKDIIVTFRCDKKDEAIEKIIGKAKVEKSVSRIVFELTFKGVSFRLYGSGKANFRNIETKEKLNGLLAALLT